MNYIYLINLVSDDHSQIIHSVNDLKQEIKSIRKVYSNKIEFLFLGTVQNYFSIIHN